MRKQINRFFCVIQMLLQMNSKQRPDGSYELLKETSEGAYDTFWRLSHPNYTPVSAAERWVISRL